jgi:hypothetical protein
MALCLMVQFLKVHTAALLYLLLSVCLTIPAFSISPMQLVQ